MPFKKAIRDSFERFGPLRELKYLTIRPLHKLRYHLKAGPEERHRCAYGHTAVTACPDNDLIPRVPDAGKIKDGCLIMHNGVKVLPGSYFGYSNLKILQNSLGVHEPQEERVYGEVLKHIPAGGTMIELGAYWAFYSAWFAHVVKDARCYLVEPVLSNLNYGRKNFSLNKMKGQFVQAYVGKESATVDGLPQICIDDFVAEHKIDHFDILHADIQGFELDMLRGAEKTINQGRVHYTFISTHSNDLHRDCEKFLVEHGYEIIASANLDDSYGPDGVLAARLKSIPGLGPVAISLKSKQSSQG